MFDNYEYFKSEFKKYDDHDWNADKVSFSNNPDVIFHPFGQKDMVNSPSHYTRGTQEVIDTI